MSVTDLAVQDYHDFPNAIGGGGPGIPGPSDPAQVSFTVIWSGANSLTKVKNTDDPLQGGGFAGEFVRNVAHMEWSAAVGDLQYVSDPLATSAPGAGRGAEPPPSHKPAGDQLGGTVASSRKPRRLPKGSVA
jgi:hypothetical protein